MPSVQGMAMFHRRLLLVGVLVAAGSLVPLVRVAQLTLVKGEQLSQQAESRLSETRLIETTRGRILDRKGRVLAQDRPGFDVQVDYSLISGQWAFLQAAREAKKTTPKWNELSPPEREAAVQALVPQYQERLRRSWDALSKYTGVDRDELEDRRQAIVKRVSVMAAELTEANRKIAEAEALERGRELSDVSAEAERPIREQTVPHVLVRGLDDAVAFRFPTGTLAETEGLLPGMRMVDGATREYPLETIPVVIDRTGFPGPLKNATPLQVDSVGVATAVVGWMRTGLYKEDLDRLSPLVVRQDGNKVLNLSGYVDTDSIGARGVESQAESDLRGVRGLEVEQLDTGKLEKTERQPGRDVTLTVDAVLQAQIQALMSPQAGLTTVQMFHNNHALLPGTRLPAAVVVIDVPTGDVLAAVSTPVFTRQQLREDSESIISYDADKAWLERERRKAEQNDQPEPSAASALPFLNRVFARRYAPGSIVKPLVLNFASVEGVYNPSAGPTGERIACTGHLFPNSPNLMRCWIYKQAPHSTHTIQLGHDLDATEGIMVSCNIFFYTLGERLGAENLAKWYGRLGVGTDVGTVSPDLGIGAQDRGSVLQGAFDTPPPSPAQQPEGLSPDDQEEVGDQTAAALGAPPAPTQTPAKVSPPAKKPRFSPADCALLGIGQGYLAWTPLHAADAYATLARGGVRLTPRIRSDAGAPAQKRIDLGFKPEAVSLALHGLERAVNEERGTGHHISFINGAGETIRENTFNLPGVHVWGKSGTADSGVKSGSDPNASLDHSWFVVLVAPEGGAPKYAIAVMVENGGSGGRVAGPLCNQVLWQLKAEGYL
ncbi:MAG: penicillin-binding transpeptidase domain-containing protein [Phycisphaerales bacterium]